MAVEEALREVEQQAIERDSRSGSSAGQGRGPGSAFVERLPLPKFKGDPLLYADFRSLFKELAGTLNISDATYLEYLRKSLGEDLGYVIRGARTSAEAWSRLDDRYADRVGAISTILKNLKGVDLGCGK